MVIAKLFFTFIVLVFVYIASFQLYPVKLEHNNQIQSQQVFVSDQQTNIDLEEYLVGVVASEMPASFEIEALKAQAVAARSFATSRNYQVDSTTSSQVYKSDEVLREQWHENYEQNIQKIREAVYSTQKEVLSYEGKVINATFFSSSNGKTNNAEDYWVSATPYLVSVDSHWDSIKEDNVRLNEFTFDELESVFGVINTFEIISWYDNGYVKEVKVNETIYSGREIRELLGLSSSSFDVEMREDSLAIQTVGSGHGVGMSQYGAQGMALEGYTYQEILQHYYQGVSIELLNK